MGNIKDEIRLKLNKIERNLKDEKMCEIKCIEHEVYALNRFIQKEYDIIKGMLSLIDELWEFNRKNGTNISFDIEDLFSFEFVTDKKNRLKFFDYEGIILHVTFDEKNDKLFPTLRLVVKGMI